MRKLLYAVPLVLALGIAPAYAAWSDWFPSGWFSVDKTAKIVELIDNVQRRTMKVCGFLPFATSIAAASIDMAVYVVFVDKLCDLVIASGDKHGTKGGKKSIEVDGVVIEGQFVEPIGEITVPGPAVE